MIDPFRFGPWVSEAAIARFRIDADMPLAPEDDIAAARLHYDRFNRQHLATALDAYDVGIEDAEVAGIRVHRVSSPSQQVGRTLICLHGGAFMWGRGAGALIEAVPVAAVSGIEVLAVEYALAPEKTYPAAVEDVLAVYRTLLESQDPQTIGMYGCSAGGILTAQVVARLIAEDLPVPGAIAMICGTGLEFDGDAPRTAAAYSPRQDNVDGIRLTGLAHLAAADPADPNFFPGDHPQILARFPASMLVTGSRDFAAGSVTTMHRRLVAAGATASLFEFDGMWHAFHMATTLPESRELFGLLSAFFDRHLG